MKTQSYFFGDIVYALLLSVAIYTVLAGICLIAATLMGIPVIPVAFLPFYPQAYPVAFGSFLLCFLLAGGILWAQGMREE